MLNKKIIKRLSAGMLTAIMTLMSCMLCAESVTSIDGSNAVCAAVRLAEDKKSETDTDSDDAYESNEANAEAEADSVASTPKQIIEISSAEDLIKLADSCRLDSYSADKYVKLTQDIMLAGSGYKPIPVFMGVFDGCGHKIDGLIYSDNTNYGGLISKTGQNSVIMDLTVVGNVSPDGKQMVLGGIVGDNYGYIQNCKYIGIVKGNDYIGGITGFNEATGMISDCYSYGSVSGQHHTGGIAGGNLGGIYRCGNESLVNTTNEDRSISFDDINVDKYLSGILDLSGKSDEAKEVSAANSVIDCGGIAGFSTGVIEYCSNLGDVGYEHVGYNVGGIVGRQSGYVHGCINSGHIQGRKDVGGITGQAEPYVSLDLSEDMINKLTTNINELHDLIDDTLKDSSAQSDVISDRLAIIRKFADDALVSADHLTDETITWADGLTGAANDLMGRVDYAVDEAGKEGGAIDKSKSAATNVGKAADSLSAAADAANIYNYMTDEEKVRYDGAKDNIKHYSEEYEGYYEEYLEAHPDDTAGAKIVADDRFLAQHGAAYDTAVADQAEIMADIIAAHEGEMSKDAADSSSDAMDSLKKASDDLSNATSALGGIADDLSDREDITLPNLGDSYRAGTDNFMSALKAMSENMGALNDEMNGSTKVMTGDMEKVNDSFNTIMLLFADALDGALDADPSDMYEDESIDAAMSAKEGTVADCSNSGRVEGDIDTAGIAGTMALEYDFDLEGDTTGIKDSKAGAVYKTRCILRGDKNTGRIIGGKSYVGGMTGSQEMGIIINCSNCGRVKSTAGDYVGGIAGNSLSDVRMSHSKCVLSGGRYIGGITGFAHNVSGCVSIPSVSYSEEYAGAIAGEVSDDYDLHDNYFYSESLGGIDRVSYEDMAKPMRYDEIVKISGVPKEFGKLTVTFLIGDEIEAGSINVDYDGKVSYEDYPEPYVANGDYIKWEADTIEHIKGDTEICGKECRLLTTLAGSMLRGNGQSVILVDGTFKEGQHIAMEEYKDITDSNGNRISAGDLYKGFKERWEIEIPRDNSETHQIRVQAPAGVEKCDIYVSNGGEYVKADTVRMGMYELFSVRGNKISILIIDKTVPKWKYAVMGAFIVLIVVLCIVTAVIKRKRKISAAAEENDNTKKETEKTDGDTV